MHWKQFLTSVRTMSSEEARSMVAESEPGSFGLLDVRQPGEYERGHIPGARLIPLPELPDRLDELDRDKDTLVYCAAGGRSRSAVQLLQGKGFTNMINVEGGFSAWEGGAAYGEPHQGIELFSGGEDARTVLAAAYGMEKALGAFYAGRAETSAEPVARVLRTLADVERLHMDKVYALFREAGGDEGRDIFDARVAAEAIEGGMSLEQYADFAYADLDTPTGLVEVAMTIEAQALDLYTRASRQTSDRDAAAALMAIAREEGGHLRRLGQLLDQLVEEGA